MAVVRGNDFGRYLINTFSLTDLTYRPLVSIVSHGELWVMADRNGWGEAKRKVLETTLSNLVTIDLHDESIIEAYVEVSGVSQRQPDGARMLSDNDKWIAATSKAAHAVLVMADRDFAHLNPDCCVVHCVDPESWNRIET